MVQRVYLDLPNESGPVLRIRGSEGDREAAKLIAEEISARFTPGPQRVSTAAQHLQRAGPGQRQ